MNVEIEERGDGGWGDLGTRREGDLRMGEMGRLGDGRWGDWGTRRLGERGTLTEFKTPSEFWSYFFVLKFCIPIMVMVFHFLCRGFVFRRSLLEKPMKI